MTATLEVCIDRFDAVEACVRGGADRLEACACLDIGGVTPSRGMLRALSGSPLPVHVLVRPRGGDFVYGGVEVRQMLDDIAAVADAGLAGVVIGAATRAGELDLTLMERLVRAAQGLDTTLHRVVDTLHDPLVALDRAVALGMGRVLASGGRARAIEGVAVLGAMVERAAGRVQVVAGGGLDAGDIEPLFRLAGVRAFHGSCRGARPADPLLHRLGFCAAQDRVCDASRVAAFRAAIDRACHPLRPRRSPRRRSAPRCR